MKLFVTCVHDDQNNAEDCKNIFDASNHFGSLTTIAFARGYLRKQM